MIGGFKSIREAKDRLRQLDVEQDKLDRTINALIYKFDYTYRKTTPPAHLTKAKGRGLVWRMKAKTPKEQYFFTFTSERVDDFMQGLSHLTKSQFLALEEQRANLQLQKKYIEGAKRVTTEWISHKQAITRVERKFS